MNPATTTLVIDGRSAPIDEFSQVFRRALGGQNTIDVAVGSCDGPGITIAIDGVAIPPAPGTYAITPDFRESRVSARALDFARQEWLAGPFELVRSCGREEPLPPCDASSPGGGSVTVTASTSSRVSGSYRFVMTQPSGGQGLTGEGSPPPSKLFEGTFDLAFFDGVPCG